MIVVDTQILIYVSMPNKFVELGEAVLRKDAEWHSPVLWRSEFRNVIAGYIRRGETAVGDAWRAFAQAEAIVAQEHLPDTRHILALIRSSRCSAYDLEFAAVAQALGVPLVTNDKQIMADFPTVAISPEAFAA